MPVQPARPLPSVEVPLVLAGFDRAVPPGTLSALSFAARDAQAWFDGFVGHLCQSIGVRHLPVYRMADGEFAFAVGPRPALPAGGFGLRESARYGAALFRNALRRVRGTGFATSWGERYAGRELAALRERYATQLREIARTGYLALHLNRSRTRFAEEYLRPVWEWLGANGVPLSEQNYVPFYFVYAALRGPARARLLRGRRVLVVTGADDERKRKLLDGLAREGVSDGEVYAISSTRALVEVLDLGRLRMRPEVVLVGAGIGASNVLTQLAPLGTVCIDAGICVDCLADPASATRIFLVPDAAA